MATPYVKPSFHPERIRHVLPARVPLQYCLGNRFTITVKAIQNRYFSLGGKPSRHLAGLVKSALPMPSMIERNRDERVPFAGLGMAVKGLGQPSDQRPLLVILVPILEADNGVEDLPLGAITGPRPFEMPCSLRTMGTKESRVVAFQGGIGVTALLTKRRVNPHRFRRRAFGPGKSQIQCALSPVPRPGAGAAVDAVSGKTEG